MTRRIPERNKRAGLHYAWTDDGLELPVIDLTHPAFATCPDAAGIAAAVARFHAELARQARLPRLLHRPLVRLLARRSRLLRAILDSSSSYVPALTTYLIKLGPENLGCGWAGTIDRRVADGLPCLSARLRLHHVATLAAEALAAPLGERPGAPLRLLNVAGGAAADSLNTLLLLRRDHPESLAGRRIHILVLDLEPAGPSFAGRALRALQEPGGPLAGLDVRLEWRRYDWSDPAALPAMTAEWDRERDVAAAASEGGLLEYATDALAVENLRALVRLLPGDARLTGTATRDGPEMQAASRSTARWTSHPRTLEAVTALVEAGGWRVERVVENLLTWDVRLAPA